MIIKEIVADNFISHKAPVGFPNDVTGLIQFAGMLNEGFTGLRVEIHVIKISVSGTIQPGITF